MSHQQGPSQLLELCSLSDGLVHYNYCAFGLVKPYTTTHEDVWCVYALGCCKDHGWFDRCLGGGHVNRFLIIEHILETMRESE